MNVPIVSLVFRYLSILSTFRVPLQNVASKFALCEVRTGHQNQDLSLFTRMGVFSLLIVELDCDPLLDLLRFLCASNSSLCIHAEFSCSVDLHCTCDSDCGGSLIGSNNLPLRAVHR